VISDELYIVILGQLLRGPARLSVLAARSQCSKAAARFGVYHGESLGHARQAEKRAHAAVWELTPAGRRHLEAITEATNGAVLPRNRRKQ
jgi:hypothetical protein